MFSIKGCGLRVEDLMFGLGLRFSSLWVRVEGSEMIFWSSGYRVKGYGFRDQSLRSEQGASGVEKGGGR